MDSGINDSNTSISPRRSQRIAEKRARAEARVADVSHTHRQPTTSSALSNGTRNLRSSRAATPIAAFTSGAYLRSREARRIRNGIHFAATVPRHLNGPRELRTPSPDIISFFPTPHRMGRGSLGRRRGIRTRVVRDFPSLEAIFGQSRQPWLDGMMLVNLMVPANDGSFFDDSDSFLRSQVINPAEISEDEPDEELEEAVANDAEGQASTSSMRMTRSMARRAANGNPPVIHRTVIAKKGKKTRKITSFVKVPEIDPCTICLDDNPKRPVACASCRKSIGCQHCVKMWFRTTNTSALDNPSVYASFSNDKNHQRCPLCRFEWGENMKVIRVVKDHDTSTGESISSNH